MDKLFFGFGGTSATPARPAVVNRRRGGLSLVDLLAASLATHVWHANRREVPPADLGEHLQRDIGLRR